MQINYLLSIMAAVAGTYATPTLVPSHLRAQAFSRLSVRGPRSGPNGVLTADPSAKLSHTHIQSAAVDESAACAVDGVYGTCLESTNTTVSDCQAVLGDIAGNNGTISIAPGFCLNWWEGGCLGRVCGRNEVFSTTSDWIVETMTSSILDSCIAEGKTGVAADCSDYSSTCGTYRLFLETYTE
ncbi:hypothetical protein SCUP515_01054 [Seiridium cupressi]